MTTLILEKTPQRMQAVYRGVEQAGKHTFATKVDLHKTAARKLDFPLNAAKLEDFKSPPGNNFEKLQRSDDEYCIRINKKYRIVFRWRDGRAMDVGVEDYH